MVPPPRTRTTIDIDPTGDMLRRVEAYVAPQAPTTTAATAPAPLTPLRVALELGVSRDFGADAEIPLMGHECLARGTTFAWIADANGYVASYFDADNRVFLFPELFWKLELGWPPGSGPLPSHIKILPAAVLGGFRVVRMHPPLRFHDIGGGKVEAGLFEPAVGVFFRWRRVVKAADKLPGRYYYPDADPISPVVAQLRIRAITDVMPTDETLGTMENCDAGSTSGARTSLAARGVP